MNDEEKPTQILKYKNDTKQSTVVIEVGSSIVSTDNNWNNFAFLYRDKKWDGNRNEENSYIMKEEERLLELW